MFNRTINALYTIYIYIYIIYVFFIYPFFVMILQPGPGDNPLQCFIKRDKKNSTFYLYLGLTPGEWK